MFNLTLFKPKGQELKERVLKNKEALLDVMAQGAKGTRQCPFLMGARCISGMCEHWTEFRSLNHETGNATPYWKCSHAAIPNLIIEQNQILRNILNELLLSKGEKNV
jgi:hypothetical protein